MKKLASIFILSGLILGSFFAQEANAATWKSPVTIHADGANSGTHNFHKRLIFSEISSETEDSEQKNSTEVDAVYKPIILVENRYIKNILSINLFTSNNEPQDSYSLPIFLAVRSIKI